jgi:hypothetical protein
LRAANLKGVLPVLPFFVARQQGRVLDGRHLVLKPDGAIAEPPATAGGGNLGKGIPGVRLVFGQLSVKDEFNPST